MPSGKIERVKRKIEFTQISNNLLTDKSLGLEGIDLTSYILHSSNSYTIYKSVLHSEWVRATVEKALKKATKSGYDILLLLKTMRQTILKILITIFLMKKDLLI